MSVEGKTHSEVVAAIKVGGNVVRLLVVDPDTDAFFKRCRVAPTSDHITGETTEKFLGFSYESLCPSWMFSLPRNTDTDGDRGVSCPHHHLMSMACGES